MDGGLTRATSSVKDGKEFFCQSSSQIYHEELPSSRVSLAKEAWDGCGKSCIFNGARSGILQQLEAFPGIYVLSGPVWF